MHDVRGVASKLKFDVMWHFAVTTWTRAKVQCGVDFNVDLNGLTDEHWLSKN